MAIVTNRAALAANVIEEYLEAAHACIDARRRGRKMIGYPAALLLLCAVDAIGHGTLPHIRGRHCRLDVLTQHPFNLQLTPTEIVHLTKWYRHLLAHNATMAPGACLVPDATGAPFEFGSGGGPALIRLPVLYELVKMAWDQIPALNPPPPPGPLPSYTGLLSNSPGASGII